MYKSSIDGLIWKAEIEIQMQRTGLWIPKRKGGGEMNWEIGIDVDTLLWIKQIPNENLL